MPLEPAERDPLLYVHRQANGEYSIAGKYNPAAIKDQMVRAVSLIDRAVRHGVIGAGKRLLVAGAGAAGASAALRAVSAGVEVTLVERARSPFTRQAGSDRIVDPTEYDWPFSHWETGELMGFPLTLRRMAAGRLAELWEREFQRGHKLLTSRFETEFVAAHQGADGRMVALLRRCGLGFEANREWDVFDMVLNCTGPGDESVELEYSQHATYRFWENDRLAEDGFGLRDVSKQPRVLISGGGDGALQDFLRIGFPTQTPREVYATVPAEYRVELERRIYAAEDEFRRAWVWSQDKRLDCQILRRLHEGHVAAVRWLTERWRGFRVESEARLRNVTVMHKCDHFALCYPFNHFLALLTDAALGGGHILAQRELAGIVSAADGHTCNHSAAECWEYPHAVSIAEDAGCGAPGKLALRPEVYDLVILRHGPKAGTPVLARQILPYALPWA